MKNKCFKDSFSHAYHGIFVLLKEERNMRIHMAMTVLVTFFAVILNLSACEKAAVISLCFAVLAAELINTAIENTVDLSCGVFNMYAKRAKDFASGAVLIMSIGAAICGLIIFVPHGIEFLKTFFR